MDPFFLAVIILAIVLWLVSVLGYLVVHYTRRRDPMPESSSQEP